MAETQDDRLANRFGVFDAEGTPVAFYSDDVWDGSHERLTIPADAVPLTEVQYRELINNQPNARFIDGAVIIVKSMGTQSSDWGPTMSDVLH